MSGAGVTVDLDITFLVQMGLFALLVLILKPLLFDPVLRIFEEREKRTEGARGDARKMQEEAGELLRKYERELERVNGVAAEERDKLRTETSKLEAQILDEAREVTTKIAEDGRKKISEQAAAIRFELGRSAELLSRQIASRVLGREVN
jgi:F-type H+-transporting ATPase subunit b